MIIWLFGLSSWGWVSARLLSYTWVPGHAAWLLAGWFCFDSCVLTNFLDWPNIIISSIVSNRQSISECIYFQVVCVLVVGTNNPYCKGCYRIIKFIVYQIVILITQFCEHCCKKLSNFAQKMMINFDYLLFSEWPLQQVIL